MSTDKASAAGSSLKESGSHGPGTRAIHAGYRPPDSKWGTVAPPLHLSTTYDRSSQNSYIYSRVKNPDRDLLEARLAALEDCEYAAVFATGMAAISSIVTACCSSGTHAIVASDMYGGTVSYFKAIAPVQGVDVTWLEQSDPDSIARSIRAQTSLVWVETMSNPMLTMVDIQATSEAIKNAAERLQMKPPYLAVDNTFLTPFWMNPLKLGADVVFHAASKYLNGHSDAMVGAVLCRDDCFRKKLASIQDIVGAVPSPFECYMVMRGLKTFHLRMKRHMETSLQLATFLEDHPCVKEVVHPGLPSYKYKETLRKQCRGYSGMFAFFVKGSLSQTRQFIANLEVAIHAGSLGGAETLAGLPYDLFGYLRDEGGTCPDWVKHENLIRVSVGLEDAEDLIADFDRSLKASIPLSGDVQGDSGSAAYPDSLKTEDSAL